MKARAIGGGAYVADDGRYWARPRINGRNTWRLLKKARTQKEAIRQASGTDWSFAADSFPALADLWLDRGCPNARMEQRRPDPNVLRSLLFLKRYFKSTQAAAIRLHHLPAYAAWRRRKCTKGTGERTVDLDMVVLSNVLTFGVLVGSLEVNYVRNHRPRYRRAQDVRKAREVMPADAETVHSIVAELLTQRRSQVFAWMTLFAVFTGCRVSELLRLRLDAKRDTEAGFVAGGHLFLGRRSKSGVNPWVAIGPEFEQMMTEFRAWHRLRYPRNRWFFPGKFNSEPTRGSSFGHALARVCRELKLPKVTPHGLRAYYVTLRRREGARDEVVAAEIGDKTVSLIQQTYGDVPGGVALRWVPTDALPAWVGWRKAA